MRGVSVGERLPRPLDTMSAGSEDGEERLSRRGDENLGLESSCPVDILGVLIEWVNSRSCMARHRSREPLVTRSKISMHYQVKRWRSIENLMPE